VSPQAFNRVGLIKFALSLSRQVHESSIGIRQDPCADGCVQCRRGDAAQDYFVGGIFEDIGMALGRLPWLFVIASYSGVQIQGPRRRLA